MMSETPSDTDLWLPLDGLAPGFDAFRAPHTTALDGKTFTADMHGHDARVTYAFAEGRIESTVAGVAGFGPASATYEAAEVADDLFYVQFAPEQRPHEAVSLFIDFAAGTGLSVLTLIGPDGQLPVRVTQQFVPFTIEGHASPGTLPAPSNNLVGYRAWWRYSDVHAYEHVYLSEHWYTWHCLAGPEKTLADTDEQTTYEVRPGFYVFAWREKVIPCAAVTIADHRDAANLRSHGALFGLDESGTVPVMFTFGAHGKKLSKADYPADLDPALW
jgi:hypothetical protein